MTEWRRAKDCEGAACIEVRRMDDLIEVRNSKTPDGPILRFTLEEWAAFIQGAKDGDFAHL